MVRHLSLVAVAILFVLAGCGGGGAEPSSGPAASSAGATSTEASETLPWPPPTAEAFVGTWRQEGQRLVARFKPDGTFAIDDEGNLAHPFVVGTYELDGSTIAFASEQEGECRGGTWVWETGLDSEGSEDRLHVLFAQGGCTVPTGARWSLVRVG
jgi:hypothetical protein